MSENEKPMKIVFAPGCFDNLDMNQEELDEFIKMIEAKVADGSIFEESRTLDPEDPEDAELLERLDREMIENANRTRQ